MLTLFLRSIILYLLVFFVIRLMGKREVSELQPFDLVVTLLIADLASVPAANTGIPMFYGVVPILTLFLLQRLVAFLALKSESMRHIICGNPVVLISNGVLQEQCLRESNYTVFDLAEQLRSKSVFSFSDVAYAILETSGELSVLLKGERQQPTIADFSLPVPTAIPANLLLLDGKTHASSLNSSGHGERWLHTQLEKLGSGDLKRYLFVQLDPDGTLHAQTTQKYGTKLLQLKTRNGAQ